MKKKVFIGMLAVVFLLTAGVFVYIENYYHASEEAMALIETPEQDVQLLVDEEGRMIFEPEQAETGIIFYPGGKVQPESYAPLLTALAKEGIMTVLVPMPGNLAVLDVDGADGIVEHYPEIEDWYMAGHSLGGSMAASYVEEHIDEAVFDGLILLAAYSTADLTETSLKVLSIYGEQDGVLDMEKYESYYKNLPAEQTSEIIIKGGNHAQFGDYGEQDGDGKASITGGEQIRQTTDAILEFTEGQ